MSGDSGLRDMNSGKTLVRTSMNLIEIDEIGQDGSEWSKMLTKI